MGDIEVGKVFNTYKNRLKRFFNHFAVKIMFPDIQRSEGTDDSIDAFQWMDAMKSCKVIGAGTSFAQVLRVFVCCNQLEINEYYAEMPDPADIRFMCLKWKEFKEALITVA